MITDVFDRIIHPKNLYRAAYTAARGKKSSPDVCLFMFRMEREIARLHRELKEGAYRHGPYKVFKIYEPKPRDISKALFRDRVLHHAIHDVIEPVIDRSFIFDSYACRVGKGTHIALQRAQSFLCARNYCLHGDVKKFFPSIDHVILKKLLRGHIGDERLLGLLDHIIDSAGLFSGPPVGLPIGNLTSQFFANFYLHQLDHYVKHTLRCRYYIRYMDDFLLFDDSPGVLESCKGAVRDMLSVKLNLRLHPDKTKVHSVRKGLTFLGFNMSRGRRRISAPGMRRFRARLKKFRYLTEQSGSEDPHMPASVLCWAAHSRHAHAAALRQQIAVGASLWSHCVPAALLNP